MIFLVLSGKMIFLFPENMILPGTQKLKDDFSRKNTWKYDNFFKCSEKMVFWKRLLRNMIFLVLTGKMVFFPTRTWNFFSGWKMKNDLSQEIHGNMIFSLYTHRHYKHDTVPLRKKYQRWSYLEKIQPKVVEILDWNSRKSSNSSLYFYGDPWARFHILPSSKKNKKFNI